MHIEGRTMTELKPVAAPVPASTPTRAEAIRAAGPAELEAAFCRAREQLLGLFEGFERVLGRDGLHIPLDPVVNLPLWELGHIGWFEEFWISRNRSRAFGKACDLLAPRSAPFLPQADGLFDSANVAHARRWQLTLPNAEATRGYLATVRLATLALLQDSAADDDSLYFFRLVLFHEDMHREAWHFMAQRLGTDLGPALAAHAARAASVKGTWDVPSGLRHVGSADAGFAFDNELGAHTVDIPAFSIDRAPVDWSSYLAFVEAGGYAAEDLWTPAGREWLRQTGATYPVHLRESTGGWQQRQFGRWSALDPAGSAVHLTMHEAEAWCRWAGRRLPSEAEWETAAVQSANEEEAFDWGEVWEWTSSKFSPYPGFIAHPYRDYSQPWFDGRPVLRGGSFATTPHMKHPRYRNFFSADRNDVFAGFRSCALG